MWEEITVGLLAVLLGCILIGLRKLQQAFSTENTLAYLSSILSEIQRNEGLQKQLYLQFGLLGQGIVAGTGLKPATGKFKWENLIGELAQSWLQGRLQIPELTGQTEIPRQNRPRSEQM